MKNKDIYYWSNQQIVDEYNLIKERKSKLSASKRMTVERIYKQKLEKGALPEQKTMLKKSGEIITDLCGACLRDFFTSQGIEPTPAVMSKVTIFQETKKQPDEHVRFDVMIMGTYAGVIVIKYENGKHSANFKPDLYGRQKNKAKDQKRVIAIGPRSGKKAAAEAAIKASNNPKRT